MEEQNSFYLDPVLQNEILQRWNGASARLELIETAQTRLMISLFKDSDCLYLVAVESDSYRGPLYWDNAQLRVEKWFDRGVLRCRLSDEAADFNVLSSDLGLYRATEKIEVKLEDLTPEPGQHK